MNDSGRDKMTVDQLFDQFCALVKVAAGDGSSVDEAIASLMDDVFNVELLACTAARHPETLKEEWEAAQG